jgi:pyridoxine 5-phosphate synthase
LPWPSVTGIARVCLEAGADGLTVHPRPDERHVRRSDVFELETLLRDEWAGREFNIEGYPSEEFLKLVEVVRPDQVTLVPDDPAQSTSDHGWDLATHGELLARIVDRLQACEIRVSIFVDPDPAIAPLAAEIGTDRVELFTGPYGHPGSDPAGELAKLRATAEACRKAGLRAARGGAGIGVNAGHDLTLENLPALVEAIPDLEECSIGHALTADALVYGFADTVRRYRAILGG